MRTMLTTVVVMGLAIGGLCVIAQRDEAKPVLTELQEDFSKSDFKLENRQDRIVAKSGDIEVWLMQRDGDWVIEDCCVEGGFDPAVLENYNGKKATNVLLTNLAADISKDQAAIAAMFQKK